MFYRVKGQCNVNGKIIEVDEIMLASNPLSAIDRALTTIIKQHGSSGYWAEEPTIINISEDRKCGENICTKEMIRRLSRI